MRKITFFAASSLVLAALSQASLNAQAACGSQGSDLPRPISLGSAGSNIKMIQTDAQGNVIGCCTGTLGAMVKGPGGKYILSNNHVLARANLGKNGEGIIQPGCPLAQPEDDIVAKLSASSKISFAPNGKNTIDAAIAHIVAGDVSSDIINIGPISSKPAPAVLNLLVQKMGATSCLTKGTIETINFATAPGAGIEYGDDCNSKPGTANFVNQIVVKPLAGAFAAPGDSGSLVVTTDACPQPVGLLFAADSAGNVYVNPIKQVLGHFGVSLVAGCTAASSAAASANDMPDDSSADGTLGADDTNAEEAAAFAKVSGLSLEAINYATAVKARHEQDLFALPGVTGAGIGASDEPGVPRIDIYVTEYTTTLRAELPDNLEGTPVNVIMSGPIHAL
jgi:hypothetical protein